MKESADKTHVDSNASHSVNGWNFQAGAGIILMLDNVKDFISMKMEGASQDIELTTKFGKIYAQAKAVAQIGDKSTASDKLSEALRTLSQASKNNDATKLIYITNITNPLSSKISTAFEYGHSYDFSVLPTDAQAKIRKKTDEDFPVDKFQVRIIRFFGEGENKFTSVKDRISEFLREAMDDPTYSQRVLERWFTTFMINASDKPINQKSFELTKKEIILPIIVVVIDRQVNESDFSKVCDHDNYDEVCQGFRDMIDRNVCDYEFVSAVLGDYLNKRSNSTSKSKYRYDYVINEWKHYEPQFNVIKDVETREAVVKLLLLTVIMQSRKIHAIKEATNLQ